MTQFTPIKLQRCNLMANDALLGNIETNYKYPNKTETLRYELGN